MLDTMKKGKSVDVNVRNRDSAEVIFQVPLDGFGAAFDGPAIDPKVLQEQQQKLQAELQKRAEDRAQEARSQQDEPGRRRGTADGQVARPKTLRRKADREGRFPRRPFRDNSHTSRDRPRRTMFQCFLCAAGGRADSLEAPFFSGEGAFFRDGICVTGLTDVALLAFHCWASAASWARLRKRQTAVAPRRCSTASPRRPSGQPSSRWRAGTESVVSFVALGFDEPMRRPPINRYRGNT